MAPFWGWTPRGPPQGARTRASGLAQDKASGVGQRSRVADTLPSGGRRMVPMAARGVLAAVSEEETGAHQAPAAPPAAPAREIETQTTGRSEQPSTPSTARTLAGALTQVARVFMARDGREVRELVSARRSEIQPAARGADVEAPANSGGGPGGVPLKRSGSSFTGRLRLATREELVNSGCAVWSLVAPTKIGGHLVALTPTICVLCTLVFATMVAQFPSWRMGVCGELDPPQAYAGECAAEYIGNYGVEPGLTSWLVQARCFSRFEADYTGLWGARFDPLLFTEDRRWWTLVTSAFVHIDVWHLVTNAIAFAVLGSWIERRFGALRLAPMVLMTVVGGNLLSILAEDTCKFYCGLSGAVYGLVATLIADLAIHWDSITRPVPRLIIFGGAIAMMTYELIGDKEVSGYSHLGGLLTGLLPCSLFITRCPKTPPWRSWLLILAALIGFILIFISLPLALYGTLGMGVAPGGTMECLGIDFPRQGTHGYPVAPEDCELL